MRRIAAISPALAAALSLIALQPAHAKQLRYPGAPTVIAQPYTCAEWTSEYHSPVGPFGTIGAWLAGWLEGYKQSHPEIKGLARGNLYAFIDKWCQAHPRDFITLVIENIDFTALLKQQVKQARKLVLEWAEDEPADPTLRSGLARMTCADWAVTPPTVSPADNTDITSYVNTFCTRHPDSRVLDALMQRRCEQGLGMCKGEK
jgi:hypothetical protein